MRKIHAWSLVAIVLLCACGSSDPDWGEGSLPKVEIGSGKDTLDLVVMSRTVEAADYENTELFQSIMGDAGHSIPYAPLGETIQVYFGTTAPEFYELTEHLLKKDGTLKYKENRLQITDLKFNNGTGSFVLSPNLMAYLSSNSRDYEKGAVIRGFRLICKWGDDARQEYAFVIKTDASIQTYAAAEPDRCVPGIAGS